MINANPEQLGDPQVSSKAAWQFVILIGVVSLFGDMTYEAARSINGPFLAFLGAGAVVVSVTAGFADFPLIAYHFHKTRLVSESTIPLFYATAMASDALAALFFGRLFDRRGMFPPLIIGICCSTLFAPLVFFGSPTLALLGMALWGIGMGMQESVLRAAIARMAPPERRGSAYGIFNTVFGISWFLGSFIMGMLYNWSIAVLAAFSVGAQLLAIGILILTRHR